MQTDQLTSFEPKNEPVNLAKCSKGNPASIVCSSQHCQEKAFVCQDQNCQCRQPHDLCVELLISKITKIILSHSYSLKPVEQKIGAAFDQAIDKLSQERDNIFKEIQEKYQFLGLNELEKNFISSLKDDSLHDEINCEFVWKIQNGLKDKRMVSDSLDLIDKQVQKMSENFMEECTKLSENFLAFLQQTKENEEQKFKTNQAEKTEMYLNSKIIRTVEDQNKLYAFFGPKKVSASKFLYRASQNQFLVEKFFEKCSHIACTLVLVETSFGKIIGGFTSYSWYKTETSFYLNAQKSSPYHFLFSLTNNDKFVITEKVDKCIYLSSSNNFGPCFGDQDLDIPTLADGKNKAKANIGKSYTNQKYKAGDSSSRSNFAGDLQFNVKEWEVWKVQFQQ